MKRKNYIFGNWKLNNSLNELVAFFNVFNNVIKDDAELLNPQNVIYGFAPTYLGIPKASEMKIGATNVVAQDVSEQTQGAYTGQISCVHLKDYGVSYVIIGHSESRSFCGVTDQAVNSKAKTLLANKMFPIICIGESLAQYDAKQTKDVLSKQLKAIYDCIKAEDACNTIIAYEPLWAIGSGKTPTLEEIQSLGEFIRQVLAEIYNETTANTIPLLYGGSVNENNAKDIVNLKAIDGCLIGGVSLQPEKMLKILKDVKDIK